MPRAHANGIELEYDTFGRPDAEPLLLVMGLGAQMVVWEEEFCELLAARGHFVIRFDNRDIGLSTKLASHGMPNLLQMMLDAQAGLPLAAPYTLDDMADDTAGLLDALGIARAHVCGASMGGMIAQTLAIRHPARVKSLVSIMSTTGAPDLPGPRPEAATVLLTPVPADRDAAIERVVTVFRTIGSPGFPFDEHGLRARAALQYDRSHHPEGQMRQLAAILAHGSRREKLRELRVPALVIHGADDPLVPVEGGHDTAAAIPGAELLIIDGMGHDNPRDAWPRVVDAIAALTARAAAP
ncbi:alpha/beta fold hydrolase [Candidatus Binatia bacterium]|nr:alpha/beta fold hydrolase [Candidatus Binatia bacterium]